MIAVDTPSRPNLIRVDPFPPCILEPGKADVTMKRIPKGDPGELRLEPPVCRHVLVALRAMGSMECIPSTRPKGQAQA
jgi:hypothetical protein